MVYEQFVVEVRYRLLQVHEPDEDPFERWVGWLLRNGYAYEQETGCGNVVVLLGG